MTLADDLTGAIEVGALFARRGIAAPVSTELSLEPTETARTADVLVIDTESRHLEPAAALQRVRNLATPAAAANVQFLYKKTDSTLRGNVGAELGAVLNAWPDAALLYVPAYPRLGRVCMDGRLFVRGVPGERAATASDALEPVEHGSIPRLLASQTDAPVRVVPAPERLQAALAATPRPVILVCDAETEAQLRQYAELADTLNVRLAAGPAAFAGHLADAMPLAGSTPGTAPRAETVLFVCGSLNPTSLAQVDAAREAGFPVMQLTPQQLSGTAGTSGALHPDLVSYVADQMAKHGRALVRTSQPEEAQRRSHLEVRDAMGGAACALLKRCDPDAVVVFGGDTAYGIMQACGQRVVWPVAEVLPGVPVSRAVLVGRPRALVTKAGDFGPPDVVRRIHRYLTSGGLRA
ncbi:MAG: four-carbon acid sugar kinase family protein [Candidatus Brocadiaceae bacterium]